MYHILSHCITPISEAGRCKFEMLLSQVCNDIIFDPFNPAEEVDKVAADCIIFEYFMYVSASIHIEYHRITPISSNSATLASEYVQSVPLCTVEQSKVRHQHRLKMLNKASVSGELAKFGHSITYHSLQ